VSQVSSSHNKKKHQSLSHLIHSPVEKSDRVLVTSMNIRGQRCSTILLFSSNDECSDGPSSLPASHCGIEALPRLPRSWLPSTSSPHSSLLSFHLIASEIFSCIRVESLSLERPCLRGSESRRLRRRKSCSRFPRKTMMTKSKLPQSSLSSKNNRNILRTARLEKANAPALTLAQWLSGALLSRGSQSMRMYAYVMMQRGGV
jgi:hypothetical protein